MGANNKDLYALIAVPTAKGLNKKQQSNIVGDS